MKAHALGQAPHGQDTSPRLARPARRALTSVAKDEALRPARFTSTPGFAHDFSRVPVHARAPLGVQAKLALGSPGDACEREAERVAESVAGAQGERAGAQDEGARAGGGKRDGATHATHAVGDALRSAGRPLDAPTRSFMESRFGHDFSRVRVHTDAQAAGSAQSLGAHAYTVGGDVVFAPGRYAPHTGEGRRLLAHELTHTIQQGGAGAQSSQGRAAPVAISAHSRPRVSGFWPFDADAEPAFDSVEGEVKYRLDKNETGEDEKAFKALNGQSVAAMLSTLEKLKADGLVGTLIGRFDHATGVNRPRLWVALSCVQYKGWGGAEESLKTELAQMRAAGEGAQADEMLAHRNPNPVSGTLASVTPPAGAAAGAVESATPEAAAPAAAGSDKMKTETFTLSNREVEIVKESDDAKTLRVAESPAVYVKNAFEGTGIDYEDYFKNFTTITFFGHTVAPAIHKDFGEALRKIERDNSKDKTPKEAGDALGVKSVGGSRDYPTSAAFSMHLVGMAVDINYTDAPFIGSSASDVFGRAGLLVDGTAYSYDEKRRTYDEFSTIQKALVAYFALADDDAKLEEKLKSPAKTDWPVTNKKLALAKTWDGTAADVAKKQIEADIKFLAGRWQRTEEQVKKNGFLGVSKDLVEAMTKDNATDWGGGGYGDIMHFDMRTKGKGATINSAFNKYKGKKKTQAEEAYTAEGDEARKTRREAEKKAAEEKKKADAEAKARAKEEKAKAKAEKAKKK